MALSVPVKQRYSFLAFLVIVVIATHFAYRAFHPQWILYRTAEDNYANKNWNKAIEYYEKSLSKGLKNPFALQRLAEAYDQEKNFPKAIFWMKAYLAAKPHDIWARRSYAGMLEESGEFDQAAEQYQLILKMESESTKEKD